MNTELSTSSNVQMRGSLSEVSLLGIPAMESIKRSNKQACRCSSEDAFMAPPTTGKVNQAKSKTRERMLQAATPTSLEDKVFSTVSVMVLLAISVVVVVAFAKYQPNSPFERYETIFSGAASALTVE